MLVSPDEWQTLPPDEKGEIVYFIRDQQGFEEPVEQAIYETLEVERQGRQDHYRRERPRLAGIEVWGFGDNISPGMIAGGGNRFQFDIQRIVVDENSVVTEGFMRSVTRGEDLIASGVTEVKGEPVDANARYLSENLILTVWPADTDGRLIGEDIWFGSTPNQDLTRM